MCRRACSPPLTVSVNCAAVVSRFIKRRLSADFTLSSLTGNPPLANPYGDPNLAAPIMPLQQLVAEILFVRTSYVKKIIEDCSNSEETVKLLRFCCWENPQFSSTVLSELLWQVSLRLHVQSALCFLTAITCECSRVSGGVFLHL